MKLSKFWLLMYSPMLAFFLVNWLCPVAVIHGQVVFPGLLAVLVGYAAAIVYVLAFVPKDKVGA